MNALQLLLPTSRIPAIDGLRGIAIIFVIGFHGNWPGFAGGGYGVDLFFVVSGFLITFLLIREKTNNGHISIKNFFLRRTLRIVPAYLTFLAGYFILCALLFRDLYPKAIESTIFSITYTTNIAFSWLGRDVLQAHTWSLSMEEQFYLIYPALVAFTSRRLAVILTALLIIVAPAWRTALFATGVDEINPMRIGYGPDTRFDSILWGCLTAYLWTSKWQQRLKIRPHIHFPIVLLGLALAMIPTIVDNREFKMTMGYTLVALGSSILLWIVLSSSTGRFSRTLSWAPLRIIGVLSYSMYLWHPTMLGLTSRIRSRTPDGYEWAPEVFYILSTLLLSAASYFLVERRFLDLKDKWSSSFR